jgi:hypothetical protein
MAKANAVLRLAEQPVDYGPDVELASLAVGIERLRVTVQRTRKRARCVGKSSGWTATVAYWWEPEPDRWVPSKFARCSPTTDVRMLPLLARLVLDAAAEAHEQGLLLPANWERAGLTPPESDA